MSELGSKISTRDAFGKALVACANMDDFVVLSADLADATRTIYFRDALPERYIECGIAENNMYAVAAGIATTGRRAFAATFAMFAVGRSYDQIRNSIAYPHLNVVIVGSHGGITVGEDGASHQCLEDLALMRIIPGMTVINPCDGNEMKQAVEAVLKHDGPVYLRLCRAGTTVVTAEDAPFEIGKGRVLKKGKDATVFATGILVPEALKAAEMLREKGIDLQVVDIHTISPLDVDLVRACAQETTRIFTLEEHWVKGGLGSAVLEALEDTPHVLTRIGIGDEFGMSGTAGGLLVHYGLDAEHVAERIAQAMGK